MNEQVFNTMMELCTCLSSAKYHDIVLNEEEASCYQQLCRTIAKQAKINELGIDVSMDQIKEQFPDKPHPDGEEPVT